MGEIPDFTNKKDYRQRFIIILKLYTF